MEQMNASDFQTADLYDENPDKVFVADPIFLHFGLKNCFCGVIATVKCYEDNSKVKELLEGDGTGKVLVIDGGGSLRCALIGDQLAQKAIDNNWEGIVVFGCIRDSRLINDMNVGIKALNTTPKKSIKRGVGLLRETLHFGGCYFRPDEYLYADEDGILVSPQKLL